MIPAAVRWVNRAAHAGGWELTGALVLAVALLLAASSEAVAADPPSPCGAALAEAAERWPATLPASILAARETYVRGQCRLERGEAAEAAARFRQGLGQAPDLARHWNVKLLEAALAAPEAEGAVALLRSVLEGGAHEEIIKTVRGLLLARVEQKGAAAGPPEFALLSAYLGLVEAGREDHGLIAHLARLADSLADVGLRRRLRVLLWQLPNDEAGALAGAEAMTALAADGVSPSGEELLTRVRNLYDLRLFTLLIAELEAPHARGWEPETARSLGIRYFRALVRKKAYSRAAEQMADMAVRQRFDFDGVDGLRMTVHLHLLRGQVEQAKAVLVLLRTAAPADDALPDFYLRLARHHGDQGELDQMVAWCRRLLEEFPAAEEAATAYWLPVWHHYRQGRLGAALAWSEEAVAKTRMFSDETRSGFLYWRARIRQAQGDQEGARRDLQALEELWPTTYYGLMARHSRMEGPAAPVAPKAAPEEAVRPEPSPLREVWSVPALREGMFLFLVGAVERAEAVVGEVLGSPLSPEAVAELAAVARHFGRYRLQYRIASNYFYPAIKREQVSDSPPWRMAYPRAYWNEVLAHTASQEVSPFFVLAVIREESNFDAEADSVSGAKGLMQLMPATARWLAKLHRLPGDDAALLRPEDNIALGTRYLRRVLKRYEWSPVLAAASYNAGPNAVKRWLRRIPATPVDEFVERIPYDETRAYVKRVISSYLIYEELYGQPAG